MSIQTFNYNSNQTGSDVTTVSSSCASSSGCRLDQIEFDAQRNVKQAIDSFNSFFTEYCHDHPTWTCTNVKIGDVYVWRLLSHSVESSNSPDYGKNINTEGTFSVPFRGYYKDVDNHTYQDTGGEIEFNLKIEIINNCPTMSGSVKIKSTPFLESINYCYVGLSCLPTVTFTRPYDYLDVVANSEEALLDNYKYSFVPEDTEDYYTHYKIENETFSEDRKQYTAKVTGYQGPFSCTLQFFSEGDVPEIEDTNTYERVNKLIIQKNNFYNQWYEPIVNDVATYSFASTPFGTTQDQNLTYTFWEQDVSSLLMFSDTIDIILKSTIPRKVNSPSPYNLVYSDSLSVGGSKKRVYSDKKNDGSGGAHVITYYIQLTNDKKIKYYVETSAQSDSGCTYNYGATNNSITINYSKDSQGILAIRNDHNNIISKDLEVKNKLHIVGKLKCSTLIGGR